MKTKEMPILEQNLLRNLLYSTFVLLPMIEQNDMIHNTEVEVHQEVIITIKITIHKTDIVLHPEIDLVMTRIILPHITHDHDMTITNEIRDPIARLTDPHTGPLIDVTLATDIDHVQRSSYSKDNNNFTKYTSSFKPPSRPRNSRSSRSRYHFNTRNKPNSKHPQTQNDRINFEVHPYHPTEMVNAVTPTSWFYSLYTHTPSNKTQRDFPSKLELSFFLDSGASISVLKYPTYVTIAKLLNIKQNNTLQPSKTLTVANQTQVPILHYVSITLNTTMEDDSRQFTIPFAVADIKYNILGTPLFEEYIQNINIQDFTLQFKQLSKVYLNYTKLHHFYPKTTHISRITLESTLKHKLV